ncbi:Translocase of chloroplast 159, chloroplastic [Vitis vinifera]|uniref:Translocase of chloroplast 159, chloroplastic n=1 Tax=Vitis vinifera TaxID=29760 RepID=A0A438F6K5_VITVI|nr:Translocase of chloroplast 159, chloroplastic [Vitis vinifera]
MESRPRVSLSAAQVTSSTSEGYPHDQPSEFMVSQQTLPGFLPIRAPLSLDSDFDIYVRSDDNVISTSGSESGRIMSEEDEFEFETASERPFVGFPDEETSVGSDDVEEYVLASPFLAVPDEETLEAPVEDEQNHAIGHYAHTFVPVVVDDSNSKYSMPTARLSMDDDCDNGSGEEELSEVEDCGFSGAGRITGIRVLEEIDNVPKFKVLGIEEDDLQPRIKVNPDVFIGVGNEEAISKASAVNREDIAEETLKLNENVKCPSTESQVLRKLDNQGTGLKGRDVGEQSSSEFNNNDAIYVKLVGSPVDVKEPTEVVEECLMMVDSADVVEEYGDFKSDESMGNSTGKNEIESVNRTKISILNPTHETKYLGNGDLPGATEDVMLEDQIYGKSSNSVSSIPSSYLDPDFEVNDVANNVSEDVEGEGTISDGDAGDSPASLQTTEGQTLKDSEEKLEEDGDDEDHKIFDSEVLTSLLKAATSAGLDGDSGNVVFTSVDGSRVFSLKRHAGLGSSLRPAPQSNAREDTTPESKILEACPETSHSPEDSIVSQVLYQLAIDARKHSNEAFSLESAKGMAMKLEAEGKGDIEFSLNILVLGKTGVGKSAT